MTPRTGRLAMVAVALIGFAVGVVLSARLDLFPQSEAISIFGGAEKPSGGGAGTPAPSVNLPDFSGLAEHVAPSVVNISSTQAPGAPAAAPAAARTTPSTTSSAPSSASSARRGGCPTRRRASAPAS